VSESSGPNDWNQKIIEEFRANAGRVGGYFEGAPMILIHHIGAHAPVGSVSILSPICQTGTTWSSPRPRAGLRQPGLVLQPEGTPSNHGRGRDRDLPSRGEGGEGRRARRTLAPACRDAAGFRRVRDQDVTHLPHVQADAPLVAPTNRTPLTYGSAVPHRRHLHVCSPRLLARENAAATDGRSTSVTRTRPGSAPATRTTTGSPASTSDLYWVQRCRGRVSCP